MARTRAACIGSWDTFSAAASCAPRRFADTGCHRWMPDFQPEAFGGDSGNNDEPVVSSDEGDCPDGHAARGCGGEGLFDHLVPWLRGARRREGSRLHDSWSGARRSADSEMWVVMSPARVLFVEVTDDRLVAPPRRAGSRRTTSSSGASPARRAAAGAAVASRPTRTRRRCSGVVLDGQVYKAHGAPVASPTVRVTRTDRGARFRIVLPTRAPA